MKSPVADHKPLEREELEPELVVYRCPKSDGIFISADSYWRWLRKNPQRLPHLPEPGDAVIEEAVSPTDDMAKLCPVSGMVMVRCRVGHGFKFHIERSASGGIWLDGGEWEQLRSRQYHDELHLVFAAPWQRQVREVEQAKGKQARLRERLGDSLFDRIDSLKKELASHPARSEALAYLSH